MEIEIFADVVCPWCYIGKVRLDAALAAFAGEVTQRWRPFQLDPGARTEPVAPAARAQVRRPRGGPPGDRAGHRRRGAAEGLAFDFDRAVIGQHLRRPPAAVVRRPAAGGVLRCHRRHPAATWPECCTGPTSATASTWRRTDVLTRWRSRSGSRPSGCGRLLESGEGAAEVGVQLAHAHDLGIMAVPTFVFAGRYAVSGARTRPRCGRCSTRWSGWRAAASGPIPTQRPAGASADDSCLA